MSCYSHVAPGGDTALIDLAGQVDDLAVVVMQAVCTEGLVHTLAAKWHGQAPVEGQQAQQKDPQQLETGRTPGSMSIDFYVTEISVFIREMFVLL